MQQYNGNSIPRAAPDSSSHNAVANTSALQGASSPNTKPDQANVNVPADSQSHQDTALGGQRRASQSNIPGQWPSNHPPQQGHGLGRGHDQTRAPLQKHRHSFGPGQGLSSYHSLAAQSQLPSSRSGEAAVPDQTSLSDPSTASGITHSTGASKPPHDLLVRPPHVHRNFSDALRARPQFKRTSSRQAATDTLMDSSPLKKARTGESPPRMAENLPGFLGSLPPAANNPIQMVDGPPSPLFFSNKTKAKKLIRPPDYHQGDHTATILARMQKDPSGGVTTLRMPRANITSPSPARSGSTPGSWGSSMDMSAPALTPDVCALVPGLQTLNGVDVLDLLEQDPRPAFLVDLSNPANTSRPGLHILFYNAALRMSHHALRLLTNDQEEPTAALEYTGFKTWAMSSIKNSEGQDLPLPPHIYGDITWTCATLRRRFRIISGTLPTTPQRPDSPTPMADEPPTMPAPDEIPSPGLPVTPDPELVDPADYFGDAPRKDSTGGPFAPGGQLDATSEARAWEHPDEFTNAVLQSRNARSTFDWTRLPITESLPEHIRFARAADWASTPLGPVEEWPADLRAMSNMVMGSPHPAALYWGSEFVAMYNAAYLDMAGQKHPALMGSKYPEAWSEIWSEIEPVFQAAWESGQATMKHDNQLFMLRHGFLEETFFSWAIVPLVGAEGEVVGLYNPCFEHTTRKVTERRMLTLRDIGERTATATSVKAFWPQVRKGLEYNECDVPFALIYSVKDDAESEASSFHSSSFHTPQLLLEGSIGAPAGHPAAVESLDLRSSDQGFAAQMRYSMAQNGSVVVLSVDDGSMPEHLLEGLEWKGFGDPCRTIVIFPVIPTNAGDSVVGFIVMGVNPRRPYDDDYKLFIHLLSRQLATSMASAVLFEEEIKRGQRAARLAALDRQQLSLQLQLKSQEANEIEFKFTKMAEFAPVGMFIANSVGFITYCNDMWRHISRVPPNEECDISWMDSVRAEDRERLDEAWHKLLHEKVTISVDFRFKYNQQHGDNTIETWVLMSAFPEQTPEGHLKSIFGCITDISSQKWAEKVQNERREEAVEHKRQQENFIDITSHEMRNPLSAILQCADQIATSITAFAGYEIKREVETLLEGCLDAANTINLCASHQKRIVDDILTLSKLDSNLLTVTPVDEQPIRVIQRAIKMFESELHAHDIEFEFQVHESFETHGVKWTKIDPSRLRQVLINLMTNAIKFTQSREKRSITVRVAASKAASEQLESGMHYFDRNDNQRTAGMNIDNEEEWGTGEQINIHCTVEDTGPGLEEEELKLLFQRFQQATPRTHVQYGGSGLGLFISRILTEMQGGQIGVSSRAGIGSKFSFYVQSRLSTDPPDDYEHISPFKIARKAQSPGNATITKPIVKKKPGLSTARIRSGSTASALKNNPLYDVLIVEDNIVNQRVLQRQLQDCGNNTFVANHGKEALATLERSRFWSGQESKGVDISVILMDLEMPVMDGMTCARKIRELEREGTIVQHIPIIAVTAYARPEQIENAKAAGIDDVISKPFRIPDLLPKIEELVGKYKTLAISDSSTT